MVFGEWCNASCLQNSPDGIGAHVWRVRQSLIVGVIAHRLHLLRCLLQIHAIDKRANKLSTHTLAKPGDEDKTLSVRVYRRTVWPERP